jgi:hypothetical protein
MSNIHLPVETLDHIVDHLHDTQDALMNCCIVSKSWVPRARKHLFAEITFRGAENLESWKETFPDPSTSPARYAKFLFIYCPQAVTADSWIRSFSGVKYLNVSYRRLDLGRSANPLVPLHGFSPVLKTLFVDIYKLPPLQIFNLILSFPLLENLTVLFSQNEEGEMPTATQPIPSPIFTGSLWLRSMGKMEYIPRRLSLLPGGIHFRRLTLSCSPEGVSLATALVERCSHTLKSLDISSSRCGTSTRHLRPHRKLTSVPRRVELSFDRPLESDKTQRRGFSTQTGGC